MGRTRGTVREWHGDLGWGVLDSLGAPGGCWAHHSKSDMTEFRSFTTGEALEFGWEQRQQDGYPFRDTRVQQLAT